MRHLFARPAALALALLLTRAAAAQPAAAPAGGPGWYAGLSAGYGPYGVQVGRTFAVPGGHCSVRGGVLVGRLWDARLSYAPGPNVGLFVPVQLRTGGPAARVHVLLGGGATWWVAGREAVRQAYGTAATRPVMALLAPGLEVRLLPLRRLETTLSVTNYVQLTHAVDQESISPGGLHHVSGAPREAKWAVALNVYLHGRGAGAAR